MASPSSRGGTVVGADITVNELKPMKRPGFGRIGRRIQVKTNFFSLHAPNLREIYQYCVTIKALRFPEGSKSRDPKNKVMVDICPSVSTSLTRSVLAVWLKTQNVKTPLAYDGRKIAYSPIELPAGLLRKKDSEDKTFSILVDNDLAVDPSRKKDASVRAETVEFSIFQTASINVKQIFGKNFNALEAGPALAALDSCLAVGPLDSHVQVGRSFYHHEGCTPLNEGIEAWKGFYQSVRLSMNGLVINMDESRTPFWSHGGQPLLSLLEACGCRVQARNTRENKRAGKLLFGLKVKANHNKIVYRIHGFSSTSANESTFTTAENEKLSVSQYIRKAYGYALQRGDLPCVITNPKKNTLVPIELLEVQHKQRVTKALNPIQTSNMIKVAATNPKKRAEGAEAAMRRVNHNNDPICRGWGIKVDQKMITVPARILPTPTILYGNGNEIPKAGQWNRNHSRRLVRCAPINTWCVVNVSHARQNHCFEFVKELVSVAGKMGIVMNPQPHYVQTTDRHAEQELKNLQRQYQDRQFWVKGFPLQLLLVIKSRQDTELYNAIKRVADLEMGVASQCMLQKHLRPRQYTYYGNLLLKINSKLGGTNFASKRDSASPEVPFANRPHIILGADVTHPTGGGGNRPSVAALVGSKNREATQYTGSIRNVSGRKEIMEEIGTMFLEVYDRWYEEHNKHLKTQPNGPVVHAESIIMFRDGVSEGQFKEVMQKEIEAIRRACFMRNNNWNPKLTYVICTKRHHARFFPTNPRDGDRSMNCLPGTCIDSGITSDQFYDFYINSHAGIQGTSRPSKYTVLLDENCIPVDALQAFVFRLAHNYVRCNRSVSMVNSAYYAHLLAFRGRAYLGEDGSDSASATTDSSAVPPTAVLHSKLGKRLYFV